MAHETVTKSKRFYCVSLSPDICKTPIGNSTPPIPYNIIGEFSDAQAVSPNVKAHSEFVLLHNRSFIPTVKGDQQGTVGGIKSGTVGKRVETKEASSTKGANGSKTIQESRIVWANDKNTIARIFERKVQAARTRLETIADETRAELKNSAQHYKDNISADLHAASGKAVDTGGKIMAGSATLGVAGGAVALTGVGAPVAAGMEAVAATGGTIGTGVTAAGAIGETTATVLDQASDYVLTGKVPDLVVAATEMTVNLVENIVLKKTQIGFTFLKRFLGKKAQPGKPPTPKKPPEKKTDHHGNDKDGKDGGKTKKPKEEKADKPSDCCPKNAAPGGKPSKSSRPVHFGTGEEILSQTDFVIESEIPIVWTRTYRSGAEAEDWGLLGTRWATPFTSSLSVSTQGIVFHEDTGRALRLPLIVAGQEHDSRSEGFTLRRDSDTQFTLIWRDGSTDTFILGLDSWLPHGYDGINAMLVARAPLATKRYYLSRSAARNGKGISIERYHDAKPGEVVLRLRSDAGHVVEALCENDLDTREPAVSSTPNLTEQVAQVTRVPRIGRIEEVRIDGSRLCHVTYRYEAESAPALDEPTSACTAVQTPAQSAFAQLPRRTNLVAQTNLLGQSRSYTYQHHLLVQYTNYNGFTHSLVWISLRALRERWAGNPLNDEQLAQRFPITLDNSYQARAIATTTADGKDQVQIAYLDNDTTRVTEADGGILEYTFNSKWLATDVRRVSATSSRSLGRREWDADGMLTADIDAQGNATRYSYDTAGNLITVTDARRHLTRIEYDQHNQAIAVTDALGHTTRRRFDEAGRIVESTDALGHSTKYHYDQRGRLATLTDANGGAKQLTYDAAGRLTAYSDCSNYTSHYRYDTYGRLIGSIDALGNISHYHYDALGRVTSITHPDKSTETNSFDAEGNLTAHTDSKGQITRYRYNGHGLPIERIDPKGQTLEYRYDQALRLIELINSNNESYLFSYDAEGRLISETGFDGKLTSYTYDSTGQLIASDCNGQHTDYLRDSLGLLQAKSNLEGSVRYAYDALGRLTAVVSSQAQQRFIYDAVGQLIEERSTYNLLAPHLLLTPADSAQAETAISGTAFTLTHSYDPLGNRLQTTLPNGRTVDTQRYGSGHWHGTLWQGNAIVDLERDHLHRETTRQLGKSNGQSGLSSTRTYDPQSRLSSITLKRGQQSLRERQYTYDLTGNLTQITDTQRGNTLYRYDPLGQLLSAVQPSLSEKFAFDPAGNLLDTASLEQNNATANPQFNPSDNLNTHAAQLTEQPAPGVSRKPPQLAKVTHNLLKNYLGTTYEYDVQGNTVVKRMCAIPSANQAATLELEYDAENRLILATRSWDQTRQIAHYHYDTFGRRIAKQVTELPQDTEQSNNANTAATAATTSTTFFVWDGDVLVQEIGTNKTITYLYEPASFVPLARIESNDDVHSYKVDTTHLRHETQWDLPLDKHDPAEHIKAFQSHQEQEKEQRYQLQRQQRLAQANEDAINDHIYYYHCDHLGTPLELSDTDGKIVWSARYKAWGRILRYDVKDVAQPLRFQGQYEDEETGLYYNRHRYYDPDAARFITQDPIGLLGGENLYAYAPNPTAWIDPLGLAKSKGGCDPCCGKNPAATARSWQGTKPYDGVDSYSNMVVKKGTVLYTLYPHGNAPGNYLVKGSTVIGSASARDYNDALQVAHKDNWDSPNARDMRTKVHAYVLNKDTCMAVGSTEKNPHLGSGGGVQYFIENSDKGNLIDTGKIISFKR
ncbi:DUF4150 domain-containing protein [Undibacterium sp. Jales W-56]|uniref:RHS repeat-associated core domain-containing protein n=1 Tax=Undibacterium sp. Jales W-56 TaxID=2897325 RepID=UPI0021D21A50|nr:RHS repeat-associated core domain-containing protein [Undibacterium sp. Jales W-56]MCU6432911.1 DUF4150 domain-containing protein [Undibacterium sp. Jales W-56]